MPRVTFVKSAQKNIYVNGKHVSYDSKKGKQAGQKLNKLDRTVPENNKDKILIAKGEPYYWWQFKNGPKEISKTAPKPAQLTKSAHLQAVYAIQEQMDDLSADTKEALEEAVSAIKDEIVSLKDETQEKLDAMPESLQGGPTGELLQERIEQLENAESEFDSIDLDGYEEPEDDDIREELKDNVDADSLNSPDEDDPEYESWDEDEQRKLLVTDQQIEDYKGEKLQEWIDEKIEEIQGISLEG